MRYLLIFVVLISNAYGRTRIPGEWILSFEKESRFNSWEKVRSSIQTHYNFIRNFGPSKRYALIQFNGKKTNIPFVLPKGVRAQPNFVYSIAEGDPYFDKQWGLKNDGQLINAEAGVPGADVDAVRAWSVFSGDRGTTIAILDTGVELSHPDLQKNLWKNAQEVAGNSLDDDGNGFIDDTDGWNFVDQNGKIQDDNHHGTFVAGILGADTGNGKGIRGVLKETSLMILKILDDNGNGTSERAISAIEYAVRNGAKIINASWGARSFDQALFDSVRWAGEQGVVFVTAAGNSGNDNDNDPQPVYPASFKLPNVVSVLSLDHKNEKSPTSSYGKESTHLGAPGVEIYSTTVGASYAFGSGTSFAAPLVTGGFALLKGQNPGLSLLDLKQRILATTVPLHYYERDRSQSGGRLNLYNALKNIRPERYVEPTKWKRVAWLHSTPHPYENFDKITWSISHPGATHLRVHLAKFQTEAGYDFLTLKDKDGKVVRVYSGEWESFSTMDALGDTLNLEFMADYVKSAYGVDIDYYEYTTE